MNELVASDVTLMDLLRKTEGMTVSNLSQAMGVTPTAVRQRLSRLMAMEYIDRVSRSEGRGRPTHQYRLTVAGRRKTGENFADLAVAMWQEIREIQDLTIRRGLLQRLSKRMANLFDAEIVGETTEQRLQSLVEVYSRRRIPFSVELESGLPVLKAHACPYPGLAEQDRSLCAMERMMFSELLGEDIRLNECRLDGQTYCTFEVQVSQTASEPAG